jgi:hypothetical protein
LRQQIIVLRRTAPKKQTFGAIDRLVFVGLYRFFPRVPDALAIVRPGTVIRWHRAGFRLYWRWKSRPHGGRPTVPLEVRRLIREMSITNPLWGAPRIHGELLKLDIAIGQTSVAKYMAKRRGPPSQGWKTFLRNHADGIAAMDLFVVPTISFRLLYGLLIMGHATRQHIRQEQLRCNRHERMPGGACTHWKAPPLHGARQKRSFPEVGFCPYRTFACKSQAVRIGRGDGL